MNIGPSKSEYFVLVGFYPQLYLLSGVLHELGHFVGALLIGAPVMGTEFTLLGFSVLINGFGDDLIITRLLGGISQGVFLLPFSKRYSPIRLAVFFCFVYAIAEEMGLQSLMLISVIISEIIACLVIIAYAL